MEERTRRLNSQILYRWNILLMNFGVFDVDSRWKKSPKMAGKKPRNCSLKARAHDWLKMEEMQHTTGAINLQGEIIDHRP